MSDNSEMVDDKESSLAAVTDDSCTVKYIEILPLGTPADDYFIDPDFEVKTEYLEDVKQEPADESDNEAGHCYVKVRFQYANYRFYLLKHLNTLHIWPYHRSNGITVD